MKVNIPIELIDTNVYRNHTGGRSQLILSDDRIIHEALSICDTNEGQVRDYYIRETYRKDAVAGVSVSTVWHEDIEKEIYNVIVSCMGVQDDIVIRYYNRKKAMEMYSTIWKWIFDE